ncbi:uncharacterized protein PV09_06531 [Verruconis gallopava]|uniref:Uncharacterized protein n=1 Tax=Verruconis gallopava TaxID=253628 RepID=A0A0D2A677_9PEZI|nr:uncharacterized protein PV09_06531 [Verruconis gallopava]KIW02025.1 hypothetical protein PV09_06531 [Verruconis gallopava]
MFPRSVARQSRSLHETSSVSGSFFNAFFHLHARRIQPQLRVKTPLEAPLVPRCTTRSKHTDRVVDSQSRTKYSKHAQEVQRVPGPPESSREYGDPDATLAIDLSREKGMSLLEAAHASGALQISPQLVSKLLEQLSKFGNDNDPNNLRNACAYLGISIDAAYTLARLLVLSPGPLDQYRGRQILLQASALGSAKATIYVVKTATKSKQLGKQEVQPALKHLQELASQEPPILPAQVAQANVYYENAMYDDAEKMYRKVIDHVPLDRNFSRIKRLAKGLRERYAASEPDGLVVAKKFTVEDKDVELDVVSARMGLARIQYYIRSDKDNAIKSWEIAALDHDDPNAYYELAMHLEELARNTKQTEPCLEKNFDNMWMRFVPYKWFEYMMKAAASGHAEACYKIGLLYMLKKQGLASQIVDLRLRRALDDSPLLRNRKSVRDWVREAMSSKGVVLCREEDQDEIIRRWFECGSQSGSNSAKMALQLVEDLKSKQFNGFQI